MNQPTAASLHISKVKSPGNDAPERWMVFLHGVLGSGGNWRSIARSWLKSNPGWGALLVDLRAHGNSPDFSPPHHVEASARDLLPLSEQYAIGGLAGHSFGGKVALALAEMLPAPLEKLWLLDSHPGARPDTAGSEGVLQVLRFLRSIQYPLASRERFLELAQEADLSLGTSRWLAMNVRRGSDGYHFRIDLDVIDALLADYFMRDYWHVWENADAEEIGLVVGEKSQVISPAARERAQNYAMISGRHHVATLAEAGHWVHADDPAGVVTALSL